MNTRLFVLGLWPLVCLVHQNSAVSTIDRSMKHVIEIRVLVDKYAFNQWQAEVDPSLSSTQRKAETGRQMDQYIASVFQGVNAIFTGLLSSGINLEARIVGGIEYITTETVTKETTPGSGKGHSDTMIRELAAFEEAMQYPRVDHTMLFTGLDMINDIGSPDVAGVATLRGMCSSHSHSVVEARPNGGAVVTMAHELGHSLGCQHDGEGNSCTSSQNVMKGGGRSNSSENFRFSRCSETYIRDMLLQLYNSYAGNCLTAENTEAPAVPGQPLGKLYGPDEMCRRTVGEGSYMCRSFFGPNDISYNTMCAAIWCALPDVGGRCTSVGSADGFTCGKDKECRLGFCKPSTTPHDVEDTCPLGDVPSFAEIANSGKTCSQLVEAGSCYQDVVKQACCESCAAKKSTSADCMYGDKASWCATLEKYQCYANSKVCCETCAKDPSQPANCMYGDKAPWCATLEKHQCYANSEVCCETCGKFKDPNQPESCAYGDRYSECQSRHCPLNSDVCCETCSAGK